MASGRIAAATSQFSEGNAFAPLLKRRSSREYMRTTHKSRRSPHRGIANTKSRSYEPMPCNLRARLHLSHGERSALKAPGEGVMPTDSLYPLTPTLSPWERERCRSLIPAIGTPWRKSLFPRFGITGTQRRFHQHGDRFKSPALRPPGRVHLPPAWRTSNADRWRARASSLGERPSCAPSPAK